MNNFELQNALLVKLDEVQTLVMRNMRERGQKEEDCQRLYVLHRQRSQRLYVLNRLGSLRYAVNGIEESDLRIHEPKH